MTTEEAKVILQNMEYELSNQVGSTYCQKKYDAIKIAIETLGQQRIGHWIKHDKVYYLMDRVAPVIRTVRECSECHTEIAEFSGELKYCPNCKARMERVIKND